MRGTEAGYIVTVLGPVAVAGRPPGRGLTPSRRQLLAILVAAGPEGIGAAQLARGINPTSPPNSSALRMAVARLRDELPEGAIPVSEGGHYVLDLPVDRVDAWHLLELTTAKELPDLSEEVLLALLAPAEPFGGVPGCALLDEAEWEIRGAQRSLIARVGDERAGLMSDRFVPALRRHTEDDPWNERLLFLGVVRIAQAGDRRGALELIAEARQRFAEAGLGISAEMVELERELLDGRVPEARRSTVEGSETVPTWFGDVRADAFLGSTEVLGAALEVLESPMERRPVVITGPSGIGKTRVVAEIAGVAEGRGWAVLYAAPTHAPPAAFSALVTALPSIGRGIDPALAADLDAESRRAKLWAAVREGLDEVRPGRPLVLAIDDAHWLDSYTVEFLIHLMATRTERRLVVVLAGREDQGSLTSWGSLIEAARRQSGRMIAVPRWTSAEIARLVDDRVGSLSAVARARLVEELSQRSRGVPGVALTLLSLADPVTGRTPDVELLGAIGEPMLMRLTPSAEALRVGAAVSVLGRASTSEEIADLLGGDGPTVVAGIDWLVRHRLLEELDGGRFQPAHDLVAAAFLEQSPALAVSRWHAAAAARTSDVHEIARHLRRAVPIVAVSEAAAALLRSAHAYAAAGLHREAAAEFTRSARVAPDSVSVEDTIVWSRSCDLAGDHVGAAELRRLRWDEVIAGADHSHALALATSGLPEAEPIDGSTSLVQLLEQVEPSRLDRHDRWRHARHLARQNAIIGCADAAIVWARFADEASESTTEHLASLLTTRFVSSATTDPFTRLRLLADVDDDPTTPVELRAEYWLVRAIDLYEAGRVAEAVAAADRLRAIPDRPVVRVWHGMLFDAMVAADAGDATTAADLRQRALDFAIAGGLGEAHNASLIGTFADLLARNAAAELVDLVDVGFLDPAANLLMRAGVSNVLHAAGRVDEALVHAEAAVRSVSSSPVSQGLAAVALSAPALALSTDRALIDTARELLLRRGNSFLVVGAGAACLGPVRRYAAELAGAEESAVWWAEAEALAIGSGLTRWSATPFGGGRAP